MHDNILIRAALVANKWHEGQKRKVTGEPYIIHPGRVAAAAMLDGEGEEEIAAHWCHDLGEDPADIPAALADVRNYLGAYVLQLVNEVTNPSKGSTAPRAERKAMDRAHLATISPPGMRLKARDRIDNLGDMIRNPMDAGFMRLYAKESLQLHDVLVVPQRFKDTMMTQIAYILAKFQPAEVQTH